jgi:hypothetical protein
VAVSAALINILHLFPWSVQHWDSLISLVQQLEQASSRELASPFRESVLKFANKYAALAVDYLLDKIGSQTHAKMFSLLLKDKQATPLRNELSKMPEKILKTTLGVVPSDSVSVAQAAEVFCLFVCLIVVFVFICVYFLLLFVV